MEKDELLNVVVELLLLHEKMLIEQRNTIGKLQAEIQILKQKITTQINQNKLKT